ncbi:MAG: cysteine desulfurase/selenocysteine lyase [bacterium]|jgi:selenocysteine lyase/cysteine desulfurase
MKENAYFDNAATTWPKPESVYEFMDAFFRSHGVNPGRSGSLLALEAEQMINQTRSMLGQFFNYSGPAGRVVFSLNGTDALNQAIVGLVGPGDHVVTTRLEHNAVLRTMNHLERDHALEVTRVAPNSAGYIDPDDIRRAIKKQTRAIVLNHASNVIGTVQPLSEVAQIARKNGIPLIVDVAQTAGVLPIDMDNMEIAILTFPGHKGLFGPMGVGGMIVSESVELDPSRFGGTGVDSLSTYQPDAYPYRMEAGTVSLPGIAGLHAAQHWFSALGTSLLESEGSGPTESLTHRVCCVRAMSHIHDTELSHIQQIEQKLKKYSSVHILGEPARDARVATMSFVVEGLSTERIADQLDADHHICARAGLQCAPLVHVDAGTAEGGGAIRLSPGYFTDEEDMQQLMRALDDILG